MFRNWKFPRLGAPHNRRQAPRLGLAVEVLEDRTLLDAVPFGDPIIFDGGFTSPMSVADLDGDGHQDVLRTSYRRDSNNIVRAYSFIWEQNVDGHFTSPDSQERLIDNGVSYVQAADINGDGKQDVFFISLIAEQYGFYHARLGWLENSGPDLSAWIDHTIDPNVGVPPKGSEFALVDVDHDKDLDVIDLRGSGAYFENTGVDDWPVGPRLVGEDNVNHQSSVVLVKDLNGDGLTDVMTSTVDTITQQGATSKFVSVEWWQNAGGQTAWTPHEYFRWDLTGSPGDSHTFTASDINGDGILDLVDDASIKEFDQNGAPFGQRDDLYWLDGSADWTRNLVATVELNDNSTSIGKFFLSPADINLDGYQDFLFETYPLGAAGDQTSVIGWYENPGPSGTTWTQNVIYQTTDASSVVVLGVADLDHDTDPDVLAFRGSKDGTSADLFWLRNDKIAPRPDLTGIIWGGNLHHILYKQQKYSVTVSVANQGELATGNITIEICLSTNPDASVEGDIILKQITNQAINLTDGQQLTLKTKFQIPTVVDADTTYYLKVFVDGNNAIQESDETNNVSVSDSLEVCSNTLSMAGTRATSYENAVQKAKASPQYSIPFIESLTKFFIMQNEGGFHPEPYSDSVGIPTIGFGFALQYKDDQGTLHNSSLAFSRINAAHLKYKGKVLKFADVLNLTGNRKATILPYKTALKWFNEDYTTAKKNAISIFGHAVWDGLSGQAQQALIDMSYNLGKGKGKKGLLGFKRFIEDIKAGDMACAAFEMMNSKWADQVKSRAAKDFLLLVTEHEVEL